MSMNPSRTLTGWLILLIFILGFASLGNGWAMLKQLAESYQPFYEVYPSLPNAVLMFQVIFGVSIASGIYTAWILYRREPGTLPRARNGLLLTAGLRVVAPGTIPLFGGLPADASKGLIQEWITTAFVAIGITAAWYLYLCRSKRVQQIYAPSI